MNILALRTPDGRPLLDLQSKPDGLSALMMIGGAVVAGVSLSIVLFMLFTKGHSAYNTSSDFPWGAPIAFYMFFLLASSGLSIISSLDTVFGLKTFYPVAKRCIWLSIITLVAGFTLLALELGNPFRLLWAVPISAQFKSPMWWMGIFYSIDLALLCIKFYLLHTGEWDSKRTHLISVGSFVICIFASGTLGLAFGMMAMRPAWYSPAMPMYFILTGFMTAVAFTVLFTSLMRRVSGTPENVRKLFDDVLPRLFFITLLAVVVTRFGQIITGLWGNYEGMEAHWRSLTSVMFHIEIWIGFVIPLVLMGSRERRTNVSIQILSALLFMIGIFASRLHLLIMGQEVPLFKDYWAGYVEYTPSFTEWLLIPAGFGIVFMLYGAGNWLFNLADHRAPANAH